LKGGRSDTSRLEKPPDFSVASPRLSWAVADWPRIRCSAFSRRRRFSLYWRRWARI